MTRAILAILVLSSALAMHALEPRGSVSVTVIDQKGAPVQSAIVKFDPSHGGGISYVSPTCRTDATGACTRNGLAMGTYLLGAMKPSDGYPDLSFDFYSHETKRIEVVLTPSSPQANVVFRLGPPMAKLKLGIIDDGSDTPVGNPTVMLLRGGAGSHDWIGIGKTADSTFLVPPDEDVHLEITADGYEPWHLEEHPELSPGGVVHLHSEGRQEMTARLRHQ